MSGSSVDVATGGSLRCVSSGSLGKTGEPEGALVGSLCEAFERGEGAHGRGTPRGRRVRGLSTVLSGYAATGTAAALSSSGVPSPDETDGER